MTALKQFQRLEAAGLYTPAEDAQRVDVVLSMGQASLTFTDHRDIPLTHWSLAALERINPGQRPAIYAPAPDAPERVEVADDLMVTAIEKVRRAVRRARPHPGRLRRRLTLLGIAGGLAIALFWLPGALVATTARIVPEATRDGIDAVLLTRIGIVAGRPCADPAGAAALSRLLAALGPAGPVRAHVLPGVNDVARHLPGGTVLLGRGVVEDHEAPEVVAGYLLAEAERITGGDPLKPLLWHGGVMATLRLVTTGRIPDGVLDSYAEAVMLGSPRPVDPGTLADRFAAAGVPVAPYAYALDITGEETLPLIETDPLRGEPGKRLLSDGQWVALQGICGG